MPRPQEYRRRLDLHTINGPRTSPATMFCARQAGFADTYIVFERQVPGTDGISGVNIGLRTSHTLLLKTTRRFSIRSVQRKPQRLAFGSCILEQSSAITVSEWWKSTVINTSIFDPFSLWGLWVVIVWWNRKHPERISVDFVLLAIREEYNRYEVRP